MSITWIDQLKVLLELQTLDSRIFVLRKELLQKPYDKEIAQGSFDKRKVEFISSEQALKGFQMKQKEREIELSTKESAVKKYETQQMQVKTNKEYSALTHEINTLKADCSVYEDEILALLDQVEENKKNLQQDHVRIDQEQIKLKADLSKIDDRTKTIQKELDELNQKRQKYLPSIEKPLLSYYDKILVKREGSALVEFSGDSCAGCNMTIRPQTLNEIRLKEKMITCESCGRILFENNGS